MTYKLSFYTIIGMGIIYNIYCDESCHLEYDQHKVMVLGALWCPSEKKDEAFERIREFKVKHGLPKEFEIKWTKVSSSKIRLYLDLIDYFFDDVDLHFRCLVVPDKSKLDHARYEQTHDTWYYKMYFDMLKVILSPKDQYRIYLDIKDTRSATKVAKLHEVLSNNMYDFQSKIIERVQNVHSHEIELLQLADLIIGAISYVNRGLECNSAKLALVERIRKRSGYTLTKSTLLKENKLNIFIWQASESGM